MTQILNIILYQIILFLVIYLIINIRNYLQAVKNEDEEYIEKAIMRMFINIILISVPMIYILFS